MSQSAFRCLTESLEENAARVPDAQALTCLDSHWNYAELVAEVHHFANALPALGLKKHDRVAVFLPKRMETVVAIFGTARAGCVFVPVNPVLKPKQVEYILHDCDVSLLVTDRRRLASLLSSAGGSLNLPHVVLVDETDTVEVPPGLQLHQWAALPRNDVLRFGQVNDWDIAAILYTSGSTGQPKGVVLSHRNMVCGAMSVSTYLENSASDRLLAVLPLSFDYGLSQLTTAFHVGASCVLLDYLLPAEVINVLAEQNITGCAAVPSLWTRLAALEWPGEIAGHLRYITNSGGAMPQSTTQALRGKLPDTQMFLMYGLTEAFRSTYLDPAEVDTRPDSIGKAIPYAEVLVVREDGSLCNPEEPGELVHRGPLVAMGYWNDPERTAERFRPAPGVPAGIVCDELAVWSGDTVWADRDGYLYFVSRNDEMIKTSGYRVSPTEVEEVIYASKIVSEVVVAGISHPELGQAIVAIAVPADDDGEDVVAALQKYCRRELPNYMMPAEFIIRKEMPRNPNGKLDRKLLASEILTRFDEAEAIAS